MDDDFWPSIYPAIAVGLLLGLAYGGLTRALLGTLGGLVGGAGAYLLSAAIGLQNGVASLAALLGGAALGAYIFITLRKRLSKPSGDGSRH
jgi:hypothetical protein